VNPTPPPLESIFAALADRTRLRLLNLMAGGEVCVCFFVTILEELQPKISRHLATLRQAGLVEARRDGKWMHYRLAQSLPPSTRSIVTRVLESLETDRGMRRDRAALQRACCTPKVPAALRGAPRPVFTGSATMADE